MNDHASPFNHRPLAPSHLQISPPVVVDEDKQSNDKGSKPFDICTPKLNECVVLKASLFVKNREKRKEMTQTKEITVLRPGMVLLKGYISIRDQIKIVKVIRELGLGDGGFYQPSYDEGAKLELKMMCLGKNWDPQTSRYLDLRPCDGSSPPEIPSEFVDLVNSAVHESNSITKPSNSKPIPSISPDICIVNFYAKNGKLGLHQDKDESEESIRKGLPVVSFSIGDSAMFLYGDESDVAKAKKVVLESGDVLIFGGKSRKVFHGVASIDPNSAPSLLVKETDLRRPGRLNLTFRQY